MYPAKVLGIPVAFALLCAFPESAVARQAESGSEHEEELSLDTIGISFAGSLSYAVAEPGTRGPVSRKPTSIPLETRPPTEFVAEPVYAGTPYYATTRLGRSGRIYLVFDRSEPASPYLDRMWVDFNTNRDLTDDGGPLEGACVFSEERGRRYTEYTNVEFQLYYGQDVTERFAFTFYMWYPPEGDPDQVLCTSASWRQGNLFIDGRNVLVGVFDDDNDGLFQPRTCLWSMVAEESAQELFSPERTVPGSVPLRIDGVPYAIGEVMPEGRRIEIVTETESRARNAELTYDPMLAEPVRPVAEREIGWVSDLDLAMSVARSENKRVLLVFTVGWSRWSKAFEERTLRDKEVVELLESGFLCVRANPDLDSELAERYGIRATPTCIILDSSGTELARAAGYRAARAFSSILRKAR